MTTDGKLKKHLANSFKIIKILSFKSAERILRQTGVNIKDFMQGNFHLENDYEKIDKLTDYFDIPTASLYLPKKYLIRFLIVKKIFKIKKLCEKILKFILTELTKKPFLGKKR